MAVAVWLGSAFSSRVSCSTAALPSGLGACDWSGSGGAVGARDEGGSGLLTRTSSWKVMFGHLSKSSDRSSRSSGRFTPTKEKKPLAPWGGGGLSLGPQEDAQRWGYPKGRAGGTDRGHFLEGVEQDVIFVEVLGLQLCLGDDDGIHFSVLGYGGGSVWPRPCPQGETPQPLALCPPSQAPDAPGGVNCCSLPLTSGTLWTLTTKGNLGGLSLTSSTDTNTLRLVTWGREEGPRPSGVSSF